LQYSKTSLEVHRLKVKLQDGSASLPRAPHPDIKELPEGLLYELASAVHRSIIRKSAIDAPDRLINRPPDVVSTERNGTLFLCSVVDLRLMSTPHPPGPERERAAKSKSKLLPRCVAVHERRFDHLATTPLTQRTQSSNHLPLTSTRYLPPLPKSILLIPFPDHPILTPAKIPRV
jgi:hypothetical protein